MQTPWKFFCVTFGCKVNQYETQAIREAWTAGGGEETAAPSGASVILVNSCAITARGERDARNALVRLRKEAPRAILVLTGCAAHLVDEFVPRRHAPSPEADVVVFQERKDTLVTSAFLTALSEALATGKKPAFLLEADRKTKDGNGQASHAYPRMAIRDFARVRPVLKVEDGCSHRCTYCIVPLTRGRCASRDPEDIIREADNLLQNHAELMISGINLRQYGRDHPEYGDFWTLVERMEERLGDAHAQHARLRISSLEPSQLNRRGLDILSRTRLVAPHLHISLQHASYPVLKRMGRGHYTAEMMRDAASELSAVWPYMGLGADIIVGFPGETPADIDMLLRFIDDTPFTYAHIFPYSRRPGTAAAGFSGQVDKKEKLARAKIVRQAIEAKTGAFLVRSLAEKTMDICLDAEGGHREPGYVHGINAQYVSCYLPVSELARVPRNSFVRACPAEIRAHGLRMRLLPER